MRTSFPRYVVAAAANITRISAVTSAFIGFPGVACAAFAGAVRARGAAGWLNSAILASRAFTAALNSLNWRSAVCCRSDRALISAVKFSFTCRSPLQWDQSVLLLRSCFALGVQTFQRLGKALPGIGGLNHCVHQPPARRHIRIGKDLAILIDQLLAASGLILGGLDLAPEDNARCAFGAHHRNLRRRPRQNPVRSQILAAHRQIGPAVRLAQYHRKLGNGGLRVSKQQLRAMADNAAPLLLHAGKETGNVDQSYQRNIEGAAEKNKTRCFI